MLFSDECTMLHMPIRRPLGKRFDKKYVVASMKHLQSQSIWGSMLCRGAADLYFIPSNITMNIPKIVELFKEKPKLPMHVHGCMFFMHYALP